MKLSIFFLFFFLFFLNEDVAAQYPKVSLDSLDFSNSTFIFFKHEKIAKHCVNKTDYPIHCKTEEKVFDNNIEELTIQQEYTLYYLTAPYLLINKKDLAQDSILNKNKFRYAIEAFPQMSQDGNSCFENPGALIFKYLLHDRLEEKKFNIDFRYTFFTCDFQILVNIINKNIKKSKKDKK